MNGNIVLERSVPARCWRVVGQVAKADERPELIPVLLRARETGGTDADDLAGHLFFEAQSRRAVGERLLRIAHDYGLVEKKEAVPENGPLSIGANGGSRYSLGSLITSLAVPSTYEEVRGAEVHDGVFALTEAGETAIDTEEVLVPKRGTWSIWTSDDPLLRSPILRVYAWTEPSACKEVFDKESTRRPTRLPDWLRDVAAKPIRPAAQGAAVRIDELNPQAEAVDGRLRLSWNVGEGRLQLSGTLEGQEIETELEAPPVSLDQIWSILLHEEEALLWWWDEDRQQLRVAFDETDETERETMTRDLRFESPKIPDYGEFETLTVRDVPITPATEADAQSWANWCLLARVRDYATSARYAAWREEAAAPFVPYEIELPTRTELLDKLWNQTGDRPEPRAWRLAAAEDWNL